MHRPTTPLLSMALVLGALAASPQASTPGPQAPTHEELFPTPSGPMTIQPDITYTDLIDEFERATGERVLYSMETSQLLRGTQPGLRQPLQVAPENVYGVFQDMLVTARYSLIDVRRSEPRLLQVVSLDSSQRAQIKQTAVYVPVEELDDYARDSALMITTVVELDELDVRTVGASMRQLVVDPNTMQIIPMPETNQMILTGFASDLHQLVQMLRRIDEGAARVNERRRRAAEEQRVEESEEEEEAEEG